MDHVVLKSLQAPDSVRLRDVRPIKDVHSVPLFDVRIRPGQTCHAVLLLHSTDVLAFAEEPDRREPQLLLEAELCREELEPDCNAVLCALFVLDDSLAASGQCDQVPSSKSEIQLNRYVCCVSTRVLTWIVQLARARR